MKLNYKRTLLVGFAFFLICVFWQAYDNIVPLTLTNKFGLDQTWSGLIMSLDNILALFLLPLFGAWSDKTDTKRGKRTPFILIGTICAIVCFMGLTFADTAQLNKIKEGSKTTYWTENYVIENHEYHSITNAKVAKEYTVKDYAAKLCYNKTFAELDEQQKTDLQKWYSDELDFDTCYVYSSTTHNGVSQEKYTLCVKVPSGALGGAEYVHADGTPLNDGERLINAYSSVVSKAESQFAATVRQNNIWILIVFIVVLLALLISMAVFRSPAVALMPDVTIKPLRSKANAIINLMGTAGGILVLLIGTLFGTSSVKNQLMNYTAFVTTVCGIMLVALVIFALTVKEKQWNNEMLSAQALLDEEENEETVEVADQENLNEIAQTTQVTADEKLPKDKLKSLIFILASVALWFTGYNAITSKYSVYAINVLNKDYNTTLLIAQAAAIVSYIPVGIVAGKIGRKKTILAGVAMLTISFTGAIFVTSSSPDWLLIVLFALAGIAWATINVNSFPMVVELSKGGNIGKYTGYYYTASMAAQVITPILSGWLMDCFGSMSVLFPYGAIFVALSFVTMLFVKHGDSKPEQPQSKLEMLAAGDD